MALPLSGSPTRRRWFWATLVVVSAAAAALSLRLFPKAFPLVTLDLRLDRAHALAAAHNLATEQHWGPPDSVRTVAAFEGLGSAQAFVELEGGGPSAFADLLHDDLFSPYVWEVRLFKESETRQVVVRFKPSGEPYGFEEKLREDAPGAALPADRAREIAEAAVRTAPWYLPLDRFKLVESSQVTRPGKRVDHTFVYERPDRLLGEGRLRLKLVVAGDRLTTLDHFVKVPEAFARRYEQMRSANTAIAGGASGAMLLLYLLGGCGVGLFFLLRQRAVLWRQPLAWAAVIAGLQLLSSLNAWPLAWLQYDTAVSAGGFIAKQFALLVATALGLGLLLFLSFLAAEGLGRRAFPGQPQFWRLWSREAGASRAVLGRTLGGYLFASISLLYVLAFYYFAIHRLGWWTPSEALTDPNSLAHYLPWLSPLANAAQAGFWEESLFRAVPLAAAALLGTRYGGRRRWIVGAFILQALVFSAAHANYPGQPAYSRVVELLLPSCVFGGFYLAFGLLPSILLHFTYDVVLMALPLFAATAPGIWLDRTLLVLLSLIPLWVVLWRIWRAGGLQELPAALRNAAWLPPIATAPAPETSTPAAAVETISPRLPVLSLVVGLVALLGAIATAHRSSLGPSLDPSRTEAIRLAQAELTRRGAKLPPTFRADARVAGRPEQADRFVWQTAGREVYERELGVFLPHTRWHVRFATFEGDVAERAEEWNVGITGDRRVDFVAHKLPEARAGATLTETEARDRVHAAIRDTWKLDPAALKEVSATSKKHPKRTDWTFVFKDPTTKSFAPGEARFLVEISGDAVTDAYRFVFVPEKWEREDRALQSSFQVGAILKAVVSALLVLTGIGLAIAAWSRKKFDVRVAVTVAALFFACILVGALNQWPATSSHFSTAQPLALQRVIAAVSPLVVGLIAAAGLGLLAGYSVRWIRPSRLADRPASLLAVGTATTLVGGFALAATLRDGAGPHWPATAAAGTFVPLLASAFGAIGQYVSQTAIVFFVAAGLDHLTGGWQQRRSLGLALFVLAATAMTFPAGGLSVGSWLASAAATTLVATLVYVFFLRHDLTVLPAVTGLVGAIRAIADVYPVAYRGSVPATLLAAAVCLVLGGWTTRELRRLALDRSSPPPLP